MSKTPNDYIFSDGVHWIANSGKDENGAYKGGRAGDQTGHEAELRSWYDRPWTVVLRHPNQAVALTIAELSIAMCLNDKVGYDQSGRGSYWARLKAAGFDPAAIQTACEQDCTAGVSANVKAAGHIHGIAALEALPLCTSRDMLARFTAAGFAALTQSKYLSSGRQLLPGDILLCEGHHAAANITCGANARECWSPLPAPTALPETPEVRPPRIVVTGSSVFVRGGPSTDYGPLGTVRRGDRLHYFGFNCPDNGWHLVEYGDRTGWISCKYAKMEG